MYAFTLYYQPAPRTRRISRQQFPTFTFNRSARYLARAHYPIGYCLVHLPATRSSVYSITTLPIWFWLLVLVPGYIPLCGCCPTLPDWMDALRVGATPHSSCSSHFTWFVQVASTWDSHHFRHTPLPYTRDALPIPLVCCTIALPATLYIVPRLLYVTLPLLYYITLYSRFSLVSPPLPFLPLLRWTALPTRAFVVVPVLTTFLPCCIAPPPRTATAHVLLANIYLVGSSVHTVPRVLTGVHHTYRLLPRGIFHAAAPTPPAYQHLYPIFFAALHCGHFMPLPL